MVEAIGSDKFSEYSRMTPEERRIKDEEWVKNIKRTKVKDFRDDWNKKNTLVDNHVIDYFSEYRFMQIS